MKKLVISSGILKGKILLTPPGEIRPVMGKVREAIFQILNHKFELDLNKKLQFLDLFSGSGLMSIEAISCGFKNALAIERDALKNLIIKQNIMDCNNRIIVRIDSAERFLLSNYQKFDVIYADPPFAYAFKEDLMLKISKSRALLADTIVIIHMPSKEKINDSIGELKKIDTRKYGGSTIHFFAHINSKYSK